MGKVLWFGSLLGWHILFEKMGYKSRNEYRMRWWRAYKKGGKK